MGNDGVYLTTKDIIEIFNVTRVTVAGWVNSGKLAAIKTLGGHSRFRRDDILQLLNDRHIPIPQSLQTDSPLFLIVDDEPSILKTLPRRILALYPSVRVDTADNGVEGLLKIGHEPPAVVILDLHMPKMDGIEVIRRIKAESAYAGIRIFAISGYVKDEKAVLKAGADAFYRKGTNLKELLDALAPFVPHVRAAAG